MAGRRLLTVLVVLFGGLGARGDDGAVSGIGGVPKLMDEHPTVRMLWEDVHIRVPEGVVTARFALRNEGAARWVELGFPERGGGDIGDMTRRSGFAWFHTWVDGHRVSARRVVVDHYSSDYQAWWVKRLWFGRGQTRIVTDRYCGGVGANISGRMDFSYVLRTGASWRGPIGRARVVCDLDTSRGWTYTPGPGNRHSQGNRFVWEWRNFEPTTDLRVDWYPAFAGVTINGDSVMKQLTDLSGHRETHCTPIAQQGRDVVLPVREAARWLGARVEVITLTEPRRVRVVRGDRWIGLAADSDTALANGRVRRLGGWTWDCLDCLMVRLRPIVEALGGTMRWQPEARRFDVRLPRHDEVG